MPAIELPTHKARGYQVPFWSYMEAGGKRAVKVWHRRAGKDDVDLAWTSIAAHERVGNYWHMLPEYAQGRKAIWNAVNPHSGKKRIDEHFPLELRKKTNDHEMYIEFKSGSTWQVVGSDSYNSVVGSTPIGVVFSEWPLSDPQAWAYIEPILLENGGWAIFSYTPRGRNHGLKFYETAKADSTWFGEKLTVEHTKLFNEEQLAQVLRSRIDLFGEDDGHAVFQQEYYCSFDAAIAGAYYGKEIAAAEKDGRVCRVPYNPSMPVLTAWDLGVGDPTAIWFAQLVGPNVHVIDYYETPGASFDHFAKQLLQERKYLYARVDVHGVEGHIYPHDAGHEAQGDKEFVETKAYQLAQLGLPGRVLPISRVDTGIQKVRPLLARCYFDEVKCAKGLDALRNYSKEWDEDNKVFKPRPKHDWASHGADAFRYLAMGLPDRVLGNGKMQELKLPVLGVV